MFSELEKEKINKGELKLEDAYLSKCRNISDLIYYSELPKDKIAEFLGVTTKKFTRIINNPSAEANKDNVKDFARALNVSPAFLIMNYSMGMKKISIEEALDLEINWGQHAA